MSKYFFAAALFCAACIAHAQAPKPFTPKVAKHVISFNPGSAVSSIWYPTYQNPEYMLMYRYIFAESYAVRLGFDYSNRNSNNLKNDTTNIESSYNDFQVGLGLEKYFYLTKTWQYYAGVEYQYYINNSYNKGYYNYKYTSKQNTASNNANAMIGILAKLNSRLSVSLETVLKNQFGRTQTESVSYLTTGEKRTETDEGYKSTVFLTPQLHLRFSF